MKYLKTLVIAYLIILPGISQAELVLIDKIECVVCGPEKNTPFTNTGITWKKSLDNKLVPIEQQIQREIVCQQLVSEKMPMDPAEVDKFIDGIKKRNKFSESDLENWFSEIGLTMQEGLAALKEQYENEYFLFQKFKSQLVPTDDEILEYYNEYPEFMDGYYDVRATHIDFDEQNKKDVQAQVDQVVADPNNHEVLVQWSDTVRWMDDDLNEKNKFVRDMQDGQVKVFEVGNTFELYQLMYHEPTRLNSLVDRRNVIIDTLNRKKLEKMLSDYNASVREYIDVMQLEDK